MQNNNSKKVWAILGVLIIVILIIVIVTSTKKSKIDTSLSPYKIGAALALSGDAASWGETERNAVNLAVDEINEKGGIKGRVIEVVIEDTKSTSRDTINTLQKLLNVDNVDAVVGPTWADSYPGGVTLMKDFPNKILVVPSASIDVVNGQEKMLNVFSTFVRPKVQAELLGEYMKEKGDKKISVIFQNDAYFQEFLANFKNGYGQPNTNITGELVNYGDNIRTILDKVSKEKPDIVIFGLYDQAQIYELLKSRDVYFGKAEIWANDNAEAYLDYEGVKKDFLQGVQYIAAKEPNQKFIDSYQKNYNTYPKYASANAYDAVYLIKQFAENAMNAASLKHNDISTASFGKIQLDDIGGVDATLKPYCIKKVSFTTEKPEIIKCW
jgi:branched-chain amino acid transport system substrate-binding protein